MYKTYSLSWIYKYIIIPIVTGLLFSPFFGDKATHELKNLMIIIIIYYLWIILFTPYKIELRDGNIMFVRAYGSKVIHLKNIESVEQSFFTVNIDYRGGCVRIIKLIDEWPLLLEGIEKAKPGIEYIKPVNRGGYLR